MTRIAVVSDMHGNLSAFEAVLADARARDVNAIWCGGDLVGKGPRGRAVVELAREACEVTVRGNWDEVVAHPAAAPWQTSEWYRDELGDEAIAWLAALPFHHDAVLGGAVVRLFHASAASVHHRVRWGAGDDDFDAMFAAGAGTGPVPDADVVVYGDLHDQFLDIRRGRRLVNCGSAGNALDGDTSAAYVLLEAADDLPPAIAFHRVAYDVEAEIAVARAMVSPMLEHWIAELTDGRHRSRLSAP
ncbi:metallophosphoesterase family protein [Agrococcus sp. SL85]|uniref:metallophosphoesterase family protein n=1 Tax=Agrococcus sp. SL85 TaxID=2995141 RepID=UPI00226C9347|nr:metallophosphoesterase family protein [Agrococcus sp. SL85]WAC65918.1 metallophosphoesterase family protein [Agrococcus sp. SL85]